MAVVAWGIQHAIDRMVIGDTANPVRDPSLGGPYRGFRLGETVTLGVQP
jgi:hypothetical protein